MTSRGQYRLACSDGEVGQQAFAVIREAIRQEGMVAIGKVVFTSREQLDLASHIVASKAGHFEPARFEDQYEDALKDLLTQRSAQEEGVRPED